MYQNVGFSKSQVWVWKRKTNKHKTHKHFSDGPCATIVLGMNSNLSQGQMGQNGNFTVELGRKRLVCLRDGSQFVPGTGPVCPRDSSCLSRTPSRPKCLCLLVLFLPDWGSMHSAHILWYPFRLGGPPDTVLFCPSHAD